MRLYFAHPVNVYNTLLEQKILARISDHFPCDPIENPNSPHHQAGYAAYAVRARQADTAHKGMNYFYEKVLPKCDGVVGMPFLDNRFGLGVAGEINHFIERGLFTFVLWTRELHSPISYKNATYTHEAPFTIRVLTAEEIILMYARDKKLVIPHEQTRLRTWIRYNRVMRPYEDAHLVSMPLPDDFYPAQ